MDLKEEMKKSTARGVPFRKYKVTPFEAPHVSIVFFVLFLSLAFRRKPASQIEFWSSNSRHSPKATPERL